MPSASGADVDFRLQACPALRFVGLYGERFLFVFGVAVRILVRGDDVSSSTDS